MEKRVNEDFVFTEKYLEKLCEISQDKKVFTYVYEAGKSETYTGEILRRKVRGLCKLLNQLLSVQEKVLILLPQRLHYIVSLLACFESNVVAVPVACDQIVNKQTLDDKCLPILKDCDAKCIIADEHLLELLREGDTYKDYILVNGEKEEDSGFDMVARKRNTKEDIALLLYTSGSTSRPKGVMLTHENVYLVTKAHMEGVGLTKESTLVCWMPLVHAFGLFVGALSTLLAGCHSVLFSKETFIATPVLWFQLIDAYQATHTIGSNFAFDYCYHNISLEEMETMSLSSLIAIYSGGEPIHVKSFDHFCEKFSQIGLQSDVLYPCYGSSEGGCIYTGKIGKPLSYLRLDPESLLEHKIKIVGAKEKGKVFMSLGIGRGGLYHVCVNLDTLEPCKEDEIGELWIKGDMVAVGYYNRPEETEQAFHARINGGDGTEYYRTGDLGFIRNDELYLVGREKEMMIFRGKNYFQVDVEWTIKNSIPEQTLPLSVFSYEVGEEEKMVVVLETEGTENTDFTEYSKKVRICISLHYGLSVYKILYVKKATIPKTPSGKIQRKKLKNLYLQGALKEKIVYIAEDRENNHTNCKKEDEKNVSKKISDRIRNEILCDIYKDSTNNMNEVERIAELGFDSIRYIQVAKRIHDVFHVTCNPAMLFQYQKIDDLADFIEKQLGHVESIPEKCKEAVKEDQSIAIIGMACNFPGEADTPKKFWNNIMVHKDAIQPVEEGNPKLYQDYDMTYGNAKEKLLGWGGVVKDRECFDASFFGVSPLEAECMDPQQRKALELVWATIEDAGYNPKTLQGTKTGVFLGVHTADYLELIAKNPELVDIYGGFLDSGVHMSIIPNRVSRWFDFHGPSEVYNTACSSSLTAIHHAVESIQSQDSEMAIAGGINILSASRGYAAGCEAGMFAEDGRCKTFDHRANGFVRSEGYGAILLKPLNQAKADGDAIYGVLKATEVNHDGQSNSLRAPNPNAQKELLVSAYQKAGVPIGTISNIEMHGTGTALGDPIEFTALREAFLTLGADMEEKTCALTSVKTSIGHTESASGIAGVIRVLLSMKEKMLPGNLHFQSRNPYISLDHTPFTYGSENTEWIQKKDENGYPIPRRAGVSSFGMGGSNAHVVLEEYQEESLTGSHTKKVVVPFSARTEESLVEQLKEFQQYLSEETEESCNLSSLAYTLQIGRCPMSKRIAFVVESLPELREAIAKTIEQQEIEQLWELNEEVMESGDAIDNGQVEKWIASENFIQLAKFWQHGGQVSWEKLYVADKPTRLHVPTYSFAKKKYWIPVKEEMEIRQEPLMHPILQKNTSNFTEQSYQSSFSEQMFFVRDHKIGTQKIVPGVVTLEMARLAYLNSIGDNGKDTDMVAIENMVWHLPIVVDHKAVETSIVLVEGEDGKAEFAIFEASGKENEESVLCADGTISQNKCENQYINIQNQKQHCTKNLVDGSEFYQLCKKKGILYGESLQGVKKIWAGEDCALAQLELPASRRNTAYQYTFHPALADAALHGTIILDNIEEEPCKIPYRMGTVRIMHATSDRMWAWIRKKNTNLDEEMMQSFDIELCSEDGLVCVKYENVQLVKNEPVYENDQDTEIGSIAFKEVWVEEALPEDREEVKVDSRHVILLEPDRSVKEQLEKLYPDKCYDFTIEEELLARKCRMYAVKLLSRLKMIMKEEQGKSVLIQFIVKENNIYQCLFGMLRTAAIENPSIQIQMIQLDDWSTWNPSMLNEEAHAKASGVVYYQDGKRFIGKWEQTSHVDDNVEDEQLPVSSKPWRDGGVYLITGGLGGVGLVLANEIAVKTKDSVLILVGRSTLPEKKKNEIKKIQESGNRVVYWSADVSVREEVQSLIKKITEQFGTLTGIVHTAGILRDSFLRNKQESELIEVMKVKADGFENLDLETRNLPLEFFIVCSSIAGCLGNTGQADYAVANAFLARYAEYRNSLCSQGLCQGFTMAVSWPLWRDGGMKIEEQALRNIEEALGIKAMPSDVGIQNLYACYEKNITHALVTYGEKDKLAHTIHIPALANRVRVAPAHQVDKEMLNKTVLYLKRVIASVIKLPLNEINEKEDLGAYGIDSVLIMQLNRKLEKEFGPLSKTLFFEYQTILELAQFFVHVYGKQLIGLLGITGEVNRGSESQTQGLFELGMKRKLRERARKDNQYHTKGEFLEKWEKSTHFRQKIYDKENKQRDDIAIIGLAGKYADADNLQEFWRNLCNGKDCITEIPKERWDYRRYFSEDKHAEGKTYAKWGGFLKNIEYFEPLFFHISPKEAQKMDPQERLFLECVEETIEDAGYTKQNLESYQYGEEKGKVGVFVGAMFQEYQMYGAQMTTLGKPDSIYGTLSSIANRISYYYNLHGPSFTVDTMCSSSLTALHLACESIHNKECSLAIAGGVNVSVHPNKYFVLANGKFASSNGKCKAFGDGGDGYVPGEGVGAVLLKPVSKAMKDGDHIYGVIKATAINHGGKVSGITVPNPVAQADVVKMALSRAGKKAQDISYVEAHGTGTALGDPIEVNALTKAYREYTHENQFCRIGSVKSIIGHCESAAGMASLTKVLLQMKYKKLVPSIHADQMNPSIDFANTPFIVQRKLEDWKANTMEEDGIAKELPRCAGISAFGAGGSNAHVIIEEYIQKDEPMYEPVQDTLPLMFVFSAKKKEQLDKMAEKFLTFIKEGAVSEADLADVAYTLQTGRSAYDERMAFLAESLRDVEQRLEEYLKRDSLSPVMCGCAKEQTVIHALFDDEEEMQEEIARWIAQEKYRKLLSLWVIGMEMDWNLLYKNRKRKKVSLPTYPFTKERYWFPDRMKELEATVMDMRRGQSENLHPLLHKNTSLFGIQRFESTFTGNEFFLTDHKVNQMKVLPGAAYLEMALAACEHSVDGLQVNQIHLHDIKWKRMLQVRDSDVGIEIVLKQQANGKIAYEVTNDKKGYCSGNVIVNQQVTKPKAINLEQIHLQCASQVLEKEECYQEFHRMGIQYGAEHMGIQKIELGSGILLAHLELEEMDAGYHMHPGMLDSAIQSVIGFMLGEEELRLPAGLGQLDIYGELTSKMFAVATRYDKEVGNDSLYVDVLLCDDNGNVVVSMKKLCFTSTGNRIAVPVQEKQALVLAGPQWEEDRSAGEEGVADTTIHEERLVIICQESGCEVPTIEEAEVLVLEYKVSADGENVDSEELVFANEYERCAQRLYDRMSELMKGRTAEILIQLVTHHKGILQAARGLSGMLKTAHLENPLIHYQIIEIMDKDMGSNLSQQLKQEASRRVDCELRYDKGVRLVKKLVPRVLSKNNTLRYEVWKENGVYLITGGAGGLGLLFAKEFVESVKNGTVILTGRSQLSENIQAKIQQLCKDGVEVVYKQADITDYAATKQLMDWIRSEYGTINGILHCAGIVRDNFMIKKTKEEFLSVIKPKVFGATYLYECVKKENFDFIVFFSSQSGEEGNIGQADYATGNAYMDTFAAYLTQKESVGKVVSINWPLWEDGGMTVPEDTKLRMLRKRGIVPLTKDGGILAFHMVVNGEEPQLLVLEGDADKITGKSQSVSTCQAAKINCEREKEKARKTEVRNIEHAMEAVIKKAISNAVGMPEKNIENDVNLGDYGLDSVMIMQITEELEETFGTLSKTLFFEYQTVLQLTGYFVRQYGEEFARKWSGDVDMDMEKQVSAQEETVEITEEESEGLPVEDRLIIQKEPEVISDKDIAIIGLSGRFAGANNMKELWANICEGKDSVTEIPKERWDNTKYFSTDQKEKGKIYSKWGGFIKDIEYFDPLFFHLSPKKAVQMDPQEKLFLQCAEETLEDAGYSREMLAQYEYGHKRGKVGVFVGAMYEELNSYSVQAYERGVTELGTSMLSNIANRVSHFYNLHGPSIAIDTMCSSALTALHLACESIYNGECGLALVGGVNVTIHPHKYLILSNDKFLSRVGKCQSFGATGDGYVPGEGVGSILIKPLSQAKEDGDHIYGVIKATALNHGGKTNGYTVPNPVAQAEAMKETFVKSKINPRTISYVEAHGTGTSLGDPIEITGLTNAFGDTGDTQYCRIGSIKSNIGHCESASGMASIAKVLLQLKYKKLVPSIHSDVLNPNIDFKKTPFQVQHQLEDWIPDCGNAGEEEPLRRAAICAFGAGGSNACVLIEEYQDEQNRKLESQKAAEDWKDKFGFLLLSAQSKEQVNKTAERLLNQLNEEHMTEEDYGRIVYTLMTGRTVFDCRLAIMASSMEQAKERLQAFIDGSIRKEDCFYSSEEGTKLAEFRKNYDNAEEMVHQLINQKQFREVLALWADGLRINWSAYADGKVERISLPTYPFAKERYWYPDVCDSFDELVGKAVNEPSLHPLLQKNVSNLYEQKFASTFTGDEYFLSDHVVNGRKTLPGAAYLEMARAACMESLPGYDSSQVRLAKVRFQRAFQIGDTEAKLQIRIEASEERYKFTIFSKEKTVHCQGEWYMEDAIPSAETMSITDLKKQCQGVVLDANSCYQWYASMGLSYGVEHRGIVSIACAKTGDACLAKLALEKQMDKVYMQPGMLDCAIQSAIGVLQPQQGDAPMLPYSIEAVEILAPTSTAMWAYVERVYTGLQDEEPSYVNVALLDASGTVCAKMHHLCFKKIGNLSGKPKREYRTTMFQPVWRKRV